MEKILITPRSLTKSGHAALEKLTENGYELIFSRPGSQPSKDEIVGLIPGCVGYLAGVERISSKVFKAADKLRVISRNGTGLDNIDLEAAKSRNIKIFRAEGANARGVAELTIGLMISLVRSIPRHSLEMKEKKWERIKGIELEGRTLGLIGCGKVGRLVAILALGLGMEVVAHDCLPDPSFSPSENFRFAQLDEVLAQADIISLHRPASPDNKSLLTASLIKGMKKGAYLINTARASLLDEEALLDALKRRYISGLAIDVYGDEPPKNYSLVRQDSVIATPHIGGFTRESVDRATLEAVDNLLENL